MKPNLLFADALKLERPNAFHVMLKPAGPSCNLNCTYCYYLEKKKLYPGSKELKMSDDLLEEFYQAIYRSASGSQCDFYLAGW